MNLDDIACNKNNKKSTISVFCDLRKAFDVVNHKILLEKLKQYGIHDNEFNWFRSYLEGRTQKVKIRNSLSKSALVTTGVPQGSILGPLLFLIFINDLQLSTKMMCVLFADDTYLSLSNENIPELFRETNTELEKVTNWFLANKLSLHPKNANLSYSILLKRIKQNYLYVRL